MSRLAMYLALTALVAGCDSATAPAEDLGVTGNPCAAQPVTACLPTPAPARPERPTRGEGLQGFLRLVIPRERSDRRIFYG
jgi:hypothetical protein